MGGESKTLESTDALGNSYPGMRGIKTGFTYNAGNCFVGRATLGSKTLFISVLGCEESEGRWSDARTLLDWAFGHYPELQGVGATDVTLYAPFAENASWSVGYGANGLVLFRDNASHSVSVSESDAGMIEPGEVTSTISWQDNAGSTGAVRTEKGEAVLFESHAFGPLVSQLFY